MYANGTCCLLNPSWVQCPQVPVQILRLEIPNHPILIKIAMACLRQLILRDESNTVCNSPMRSYSPMLNSTYLYPVRIFFFSIPFLQIKLSPHELMELAGETLPFSGEADVVG